MFFVYKTIHALTSMNVIIETIEINGLKHDFYLRTLIIRMLCYNTEN